MNLSKKVIPKILKIITTKENSENPKVNAIKHVRSEKARHKTEPKKKIDALLAYLLLKETAPVTQTITETP